MTRRHRPQRGFVVLVVLLMLAVVTALALAQLDVVNNESIVSVRAEEEVQARAMAESCLALLQTYAEDYIGTNPPGFLNPDFDGLLDRDRPPGANTTNDDHLPSFTTTRVFVPTGSTGIGHQWGFLPRGTNPNLGACLFRIEDNSDDAFPANSVPIGTTSAGPPAEGTGRDVANRDRDRAVYLTAIGLYPVRGPAATAYQNAHARVTLRRLFAVNNPPIMPPAVQACSDVSIQSTADVTGVGGIMAGDDTTPGTITFGGSTCGCGQFLAGSVTPGTPPTACADCAPGSSPSVSTGAVPNCVGPPTPNATYYMDNKGFGNPAVNNNNIGDPSTCKVFIDRDGKTFVWDTTDTFANDTSHAIYGPALVAGGTPNAPVHNCQSYTEDPVQLPCTWTTTGTERIACDFANADPKLRQTPCWKPIALLGDGTARTSDVTIGGPGVDLSNGYDSAYVEMSSDENDEDLLFIKNVPIPNVKDSTKRFATGSAATTMCGDPNGCQECDRPTADKDNDWWTECSKPSGATCEDFHAHAHQNNRHVPWPTVFAWDIAPGFDIEFEYEGGATDPMNVTILTNGNVKFKNDVSFCCAECGTGGACQKPNTNPGVTGKFIPPASCFIGSPEVPLPSFPVPPPPSPPPPPLVASGYGYSFKADGVCTLVGNSTVIGDVECGSLSLPGDPCIVGNIVATGGSGSVGCNSAPCTASANVGVCISGDTKMIGDIYAQGSVCSLSNSSLDGDIFSNANISLSSNTVVDGQIFAIGDVTLQSNAVVRFDGGGVVLSAGNQGLSSFMESTW